MEDEKEKRYEDDLETIKPMEALISRHKKIRISLVKDNKYGVRIIDIKQFVRFVNQKTGKAMNPNFYPSKGSSGNLKIHLNSETNFKILIDTLTEFINKLEKTTTFKREMMGVTSFTKAIARRHAEAENREKRNAKKRQFSMFE